ncbi:MAG: DUF1801 domain-containing protein [Candidatus Eremiobacteraeota bacterium]|nr:DUF1801 domain-containing protein [Candidatus Eremiobacteraeota bacterium]
MKKPTTASALSVTDYFTALDAERRTALEALRSAIRAAAPEAEECISYGMPAFRLRGKLLVWFGAAKHHCSFYPGAYPIKVHAEELESYQVGKGTIRFQAKRPLPAALVRKLVKTRIAEHHDDAA